MREESGRRGQGVGGDCLVRPPGSALLSFSGAPLREALVAKLAQEPHVVLATGTIVQSDKGLSLVTGVDPDSFNKMSGGFEYPAGGPIKVPNDILIDDYYACSLHAHAGSTI